MQINNQLDGGQGFANGAAAAAVAGHDVATGAHVIPAPSNIPVTTPPHLMTWVHRRTESGYQEFGVPLFSASFTDCAALPTFKSGTAVGAIANGVLSIPASSVDSYNGWSVGFKSPSGIIEATILSMPTTGTYAKLSVAWVLSTQFSLRAQYDHIANKVELFETWNGNVYSKSSQLSYTATFPMRLALEFNTGSVNIRVNGKLVLMQNTYWEFGNPADWINGFISSAANPGFASFNDADKASFITSTDSSSPFTVSSIKVTTGAGISWREPYVIRHKDGTPYQRNGKYYLVACDASETYNDDIRAMENGIYSFDPTTFETVLVSRIHWKLHCTNGQYPDSLRVCQFSDGQIIYDDDAGEWIFFSGTSSYNTLFVPAYLTRRHLYGRSKGDPIAPGVFVVEGPEAVQAVAFPDEHVGPYNACLQFIDGKWWCASTMNGKLFLSWSLDIISGWTMGTVDSSPDSGEGARWMKAGAHWYLLFGTHDGFRVYSFSSTNAALTLQGTVVPPQLRNQTDYNSPGTHPCVLEWLGGDGKTHYTMIAPDGYKRADMPMPDWTYGRRVILEAAETTAGAIHPRHLLT